MVYTRTESLECEGEASVVMYKLLMTKFCVIQICILVIKMFPAHSKIYIALLF